MQMYFIAIVLPPALDKRILDYKKWMSEKYNCKVALKSPAHITITPPFWMEEEKEERLKTDIKNIVTGVKSFVVYTNNFSAFEPRTLFVAIKDCRELQELKQRSDNQFREADYKIKIENRSFHPHITIATRDLHKKDFAAAWEHFEKKVFEEEFAATGLSLLKHNGRSWDVVYIAPFSTLL